MARKLTYEQLVAQLREKEETISRLLAEKSIQSVKKTKPAVRPGKISTSLTDASEKTFRLALKNVPVTVASQDSNLTFIWAFNQKTVDPAAVLGKTDFDLFAKKDAEKLTRLKQQVLETGKPLNEKMWITSNGKKVYLDLFLEPALDDAGNIIGINSATVNLTSQKLAEDSLQESEDKYRSLFENNSAGVALCRMIFNTKGKPVDYRFISINSLFEKFIGRTNEQISGKSAHEVLPNIQPKAIETFGKVVKTGKPAHFENFSRDVNKWFAVYAYCTGKGQFAYSVIDITDGKKSEEALKLSENSFRILWDTMTHGVVYQDAAGTIISMNPAAENILGITHDDYMGSSSEQQENLTIKEDGTPFPGLEHPAMVALRTGKQVDNVTMGVFNPREKRYRWIKVTAVPQLKDGEKKPYQVYTIFDDITQREEAEKALKDSEERFRILTEFSPVLTSVSRVSDSVLLYVNKAYAESLGYKLENMVGKNAVNVYFSPAERKAVIDKLKKQGFLENLEVRIKKADGTPLWTSSSARFINFNGEPAILATSINITDRKAADEALRATEQSFKRLYDAMNEGMVEFEVVFNRSGKPVDYLITSINPAFEKFTSLNIAKAKGKRLSEIYGDGIPSFTGIYAGVVKTGKPAAFEAFFPSFAKYYNISVFSAGDGKIASIFTDISARKIMEKELAQEKDFSAAIFENAGALTIVIDGQGRIIRFNHECETVTGYSFAEVDGRVFWEFLIPPEDMLGVKETWHRLTLGDFPNSHENHWQMKDGSQRYISFTNTALFSPDGKVEYVIASGIDITERKNAQDLLTKARHRLEEAQRISHLGSWEWKVGTGELQWSRELYEIYGVDPDTFTPNMEVFAEFIHPDDREAMSKIVGELTSEGRSVELDFRIIRTGGSLRHLHATSAVSVVDADGKPVILTGTTLDITARKIAEETARATLNRFYAILSEMPLGVLLVSDEGITEFANQAFCEIYALSQTPNELVHLTSQEIINLVKIHYDNPDEAASHINEIVTQNKIVKNEEIRLKGDRIALRYFIPISLGPNKSGRLWIHHDITELKKAEEALHQSEERLHRVAKDVHLALFEWNTTKDTSYWSPEAYELFDIAPDTQITYQRWIDIIHPEDRERINAHTPEVKLRTPANLRGLSGRDEYRVQHKDGNTIWLETTFVYDVSNGDIIVRGVVRDVTARKKAELALRQSEERLNRVTQAVHLAMFEWNTTKDIPLWSPEAYELFDIEPGTLITYQRWIDSVHPEDRERIDIRTPEAMRQPPADLHGLSGRNEYRVLHKDGTTIWVETTFVYDVSSGDIIMRGVVRDVTARKMTDLALQDALQRLNAHINNSPLAIIEFDPWFRITRWSAEAEHIFGWSAPEVLGKAISDFKWVYDEDVNNVDKVSADLSSGNYESKKNVNRNYTKDGRVVWCEWYNSSIYDADGKLTSILSQVLDITVRKKTEMDVARLNRELRAIRECDQIVVRAADEQTLLADVCRTLCTTAGYSLAWVGEVEQDAAKSVKPLVWHGDDEYIKKMNITWADTDRGQGPTGKAIREGKTFYFQDYISARQAGPWRQSALKLGYRSSIAIPLKNANNDVFAVISLYSPEPNAFNPGEIELLEELARDLAFGIIALREKIKRQQAETELVHVASFPRLNPDPVIELDETGVVIYLNPAAESLFPEINNTNSNHPFLAAWKELYELKSFSSNTPIRRELIFNGSWYDQTISYVPLLNTYRIYCRNINARKLMEDLLQKNEERFRMLSEINALLLTTRHPEQAVNEIAKKVLTYLDADAFFNFIIDEGSGRLRLNAYSGIPAKTAKEIEWLDYGSAICGCVARDNNPIVSTDVQTNGDERAALVRSFGIQAYASYPLRNGANVIGTVSFGTRRHKDYSADQLSLIENVAGQISVAMQRKKSEDQLKLSEERFYLAFHASPVALSISRVSDGLFIDVNEAFLKLFEYNRTEVIDIKAAQLNIYDNPLDRSNILDMLQKNGRAVNYEVTARTKTGKHIQALTSAEKIDFAGKSHIIWTTINVTDRKIAEENLIKEKTFTETTVNSLPGVYYVFSQDEKFLRWNHNFELVTGYTAEEFTKLKPTDLFDGEDKLRVTDAIRRVFTEGKADIEANIVTKNGKKIFYYLTGFRMIDEGVPYLVGSGIDVSEREQAEQLLTETSNYLNSLLDYANAPIIVWDPYFRISRFNPAFERLTGYKSHDVIGLSLDILFPEHKKTESLELIRLTLTGERWDVVEIPIRRIDGEERTVLWNSANVYNPAGKEIIATIAQGQDITERKQTEQLLKETSDYLNSLFDYANAPIIVWDYNLTITRFNHAFERLTGINSADAIGNRLDILFPPEKVGEAMTIISRANAGERLDAVEISIKSNDGKNHIVLWNSAPLFGLDDDKMMATIAQGQDITERKHAEDEIHKLNEILKQRAALLESANKELEAFAYSVSHDLRAPLRTMNGFSQALQEDYAGVLDDAGKNYLSRIQKSAELMSQLIDDMLQLSRLTRAEMQFSEVNISEQAQSIANEISTTHPKRHVEFSITPGLKVQGDGNLLRVALENLLENAWKFTGKQEKAKIEFGVTEKDGKKVYFVRDNGAGFDMTYANKLFKPFQRLHSNAEFPGTGIGLASVQRIINRHGGKVWAEAAVGKGAAFYFTLE